MKACLFVIYIQVEVYTRGQFQVIIAPLMKKVLNDEELLIGGGTSFASSIASSNKFNGHLTFTRFSGILLVAYANNN